MWNEEEYPPTLTTRLEDTLLEVSARGDVTRMKQLLQREEMQSAALIPKKRRYFEDLERTIRYLLLMLETAAKSGQSLMVEYLVEFGHQHDMKTENMLSRDVVSAGLDSENANVLKTMFGFMPEIVTYDLGHGISPLSSVIAHGINLALSRNTDFPSLSNAYLPTVTFLVENGAKPTASNTPGCPLEAAAGRSSLQIVEVLLKYSDSVAGTGACHAAAKYNRVDVLEVLIAHGADINEKFVRDNFYVKHGGTPLHDAARHKSNESVKWLLSHGAELDLKDAEGKTPAEVEAQEGGREIMYFLNSSGGGRGGSGGSK